MRERDWRSLALCGREMARCQSRVWLAPRFRITLATASQLNQYCGSLIPQRQRAVHLREKKPGYANYACIAITT
jgi:hypothetical protein